MPAVGNLLGLSIDDAPANGAVNEHEAMVSKDDSEDRAQGKTHRTTELRTTVRARTDNAQGSRVALGVRASLELASLLSRHDGWWVCVRRLGGGYRS